MSAVVEDDFPPAPSNEIGASIAPPNAQKSSEPKKEKPKKPAKQKPEAKSKDAGGEKKKETKLGITAKKSAGGVEFADWYTQVCTVAELISYYDVSGCYILRPWAFSIWEKITAWFDGEIKKIGVENACFPLFVTEEALTKEKDHVEGFAAEVAWVTKSGRSELQRPIAIRPTSETVMYPYYAQWIRSWRDLPLRLNQWTNVVRWEFSNPTPFIRTREFLWQEGHCAYASKEEADTEVHYILDRYAQVYTDLLAVPVTKGYKSAAEKFAGSLYSASVEGFVPVTGRGIQAGTSHALGQNFSKMFGIEYEAQDKTSQLAWQTSWGLSTRSIGVMIMVHGDDKGDVMQGLVLPPRVASVQVIVIPIRNSKSSQEDSDALTAKAESIVEDLRAKGIRVKSDLRDIYTPGWKYNHWETKGVPLRLAIGAKDMEKRTAEVARRDRPGVKEFVPWEELTTHVADKLEEIQADMYQKALEEYNSCREVAYTWEEFMAALNRRHMILAPWCDEAEVEKQVKVDSTGLDANGVAQMGAKTLCIPLDQPDLPEGTKCFKTGKPAKNWALWGRSY